MSSTIPLVAEALATSLANRKLLEVDFPFVLFERDSLIVIQVIQGIPSTQLWAIDSVIKDLSSFLSSFSFWNLSHVYRELNSLTKWALICNHTSYIPIVVSSLGVGRFGCWHCTSWPCFIALLVIYYL